MESLSPPLEVSSKKQRYSTLNHYRVKRHSKILITSSASQILDGHALLGVISSALTHRTLCSFVRTWIPLPDSYVNGPFHSWVCTNGWASMFITLKPCSIRGCCYRDYLAYGFFEFNRETRRLMECTGGPITVLCVVAWALFFAVSSQQQDRKPTKLRFVNYLQVGTRPFIMQSSILFKSDNPPTESESLDLYSTLLSLQRRTYGSSLLPRLVA